MNSYSSAVMKAARVETARDLLIVSTFGFWAFVLGFAPVIAINMFGS